MGTFFFQAEDGIRDYKVTGVQTCALPIWRMMRILRGGPQLMTASALRRKARRGDRGRGAPTYLPRSGERRVGERGDLGGRRIIKKKKRRSSGRDTFPTAPSPARIGARWHG